MDAQDEIRRRLAVFFQNDRKMVDRYLERFGPHLSMQNIQAVRAEMGFAPPPSAVPLTTSNPQASAKLQPSVSSAISEPQTPNLGDDPIFVLEVECPVCHKLGLPFRELRAKSLNIYSDQFTAPLYAPSHGYRQVNYALEAVCVCSKCGYASPDRKDFHYTSPYTKETSFAPIKALVAREIVDGMAERLTMIEDDPYGPALFRSPRSSEAGILSWRLALLRTDVEKRNAVPLAWYKSGFYWLRIASIERQAKIPDQASLEMALKEFEEAFRRSDNTGPATEFQTLYILGALHLRLGDRKTCRQFWGMLDKIRQDAEQNNQASTKAAVQPWIEKAGQLWELRDESDAFELPKAPV